MQPHIRPMTKSDKPVVMRLLQAIPEFKPIEVVVAEELIDSYLDDPSGSGYHIVVSEVNSCVAGYICYGPTPLTEGTWDIYWIAVAPDEQGHGLGKALVAFAEEKITGAKGRLILIETASKPEYEKTQRFYYSQGYELVSRISDFYAPADDRLTLMKRLG